MLSLEALIVGLIVLAVVSIAWSFGRDHEKPRKPDQTIKGRW